MSTEDKFAAIAQETLRQAAEVECSLKEYQDGLQQILDDIEETLCAAKETP